MADEPPGQTSETTAAAAPDTARPRPQIDVTRLAEKVYQLLRSDARLSMLRDGRSLRRPGAP